ncbi:MAG TPA: polysaccharide pyruvyl transferase family protein [Allosphingosinicella sp.]|nr:polysaccharide pyruvyl transferase family protein [Allosphingosinicella sp.]
MRVVITNVVALNGGDGAILLGVIKTVRRAFPDADIVVLDSNAPISRRIYPEIRFEQLHPWPSKGGLTGRLLRRIARIIPGIVRLGRSAEANAATYAAADLIISTGGTYLVEHYSLLSRFQQIDLAVASGKPVVLFTQSLGPFVQRTNIHWLRRLAPHLDLILLRDERSLTNLREIGAAGKRMLVVGDAAFALADPAVLERGRQRRLSARPKIAISVRAWKHFRRGSPEQNSHRYRSAIAATVTQLVVGAQAEITFLSTCQGIPEYWTDDSKEALEITSLLDPDVLEHVTVDESFRRAEKLIEELEEFDLVIATRMHMAILALCAATPVFPIAYEFKTAELFHKLGLGHSVVDIEDASPESLPDQILEFINNIPTFRDQLIDGLVTLHHSAIGASWELVELVNGIVISAETKRR